MNELDVVILVIVGISGLMSFRVGLIREVFALGALLIGLLGAVVIGRTYASQIPDFMGCAWATEILFFFICFLA
ncbi:MAG: CvpA family protein, partial [Candidatus Eisenbacteria sp.]|nr:CvpA family protein [Candidatus Eisenbacteria bacterium]